jgi:hypothetical protein
LSAAFATLWRSLDGAASPALAPLVALITCGMGLEIAALR